MSSAFALTLAVVSAGPVQPNGKYQFEVGLSGVDTSTSIATSWKEHSNGQVLWNETLTIKLQQKGAINLGWAVYHQPSGDKKVLELVSGLATLNFAANERQQLTFTGSSRQGIFDSIAVDLEAMIARNDSIFHLAKQESNSPHATAKTQCGLLFSTVKTLMHDELTVSLTPDIISDCADDANALIQSFVERDQPSISQSISKVSCSQRLYNGSKLALTTGKHYLTYPISQCSVQLNFSMDDSKCLLLTFSHRFAVWKWVLWIRLAFESWTRNSVARCEPTMTAPASITTIDGSRVTGTISVSVARPFELIVDGEKGRSLQSLRELTSLILSCDAVPPGRYSISTQIKDCQGTHSSYSGERTLSLSRWRLLERMRDSVTQALPIKTSLLDLIGQGERILCVKVDETTQFVREQDADHRWLGSCVLEDFTRSSLSDHATLETNVRQSPSATLKYCDAQPTNGASLLLFDGQHRLVGQKLLKISEIIPSLTSRETKTADERVSAFLRGDFVDQKEVSISFDNELSWTVDILRSENLVLPSNLSSQPIQLHVKCKLCDGDGHSHYKSSPLSASPAVPFAKNPDWKAHRFTFQAHEGVESAEFIRVEVFASWGVKVATHLSLGGAFILFSSFSSDRKEIVLPLLNFRNTPHMGIAKDGHIASIVLSIHRQARSRQCQSDTMKLSCSYASVRDASLSRFSFPAECLVNGCELRLNVDKERENVSVNLNFLYLELELQSEELFSSVDLPDNDNWRMQLQAKYPGAILAVCKERGDLSDSVVRLDYESVLSCNCISASMVLLKFVISRFFRTNQGSKFEEAVVECFVSNCPADRICLIIEERKSFAPLRLQLERVMKQGALEEDKDAGWPSRNASAPLTESLSAATALFAEIDMHSQSIEDDLRELSQQRTLTPTGISSKNNVLAAGRKTDIANVISKSPQESVLLSRLCRLRLLSAALLGAGLSGTHDFTLAAVEQVVERDLQKMRSIVQDSAVATAVNKVEYLFDTAEKRLRDAAICGWKYRDGPLQQCAEYFVNAYYAEIIALLSEFFDQNNISKVKGLSSRLELINVCMKYNDRLQCIVESALRPYELRCEPEARLSLHLDVETLVSWYATVLGLEMRDKVDRVVTVWRDKEKDVTGQAELYSFPLPWLPQRSGLSQQFCSSIPEDLSELLLTYLQFARVDEEDISQTFRSYVGVLDAQLSLSFAGAFTFLCQRYRDSLRELHWLNNSLQSPDEQVIEAITWLCGCANDAERALAIFRSSTPSLALRNEASTSTKDSVERAKKQTESEFIQLHSTFCHVLSSLVMQRVFADREQLLRASLSNMWLATSTEQQDIFASLAIDVSTSFKEFSDFLSLSSRQHVFSLCCLKIAVLGCSLLRILRSNRVVLKDANCQRLLSDWTAAMNIFLTEAKHLGLQEEQAVAPWQSLVRSRALLLSPFLSAEFVDEVKYLTKQAELFPGRGAAVHGFLRSCLAIRGITSCMSKSLSVTLSAPMMDSQKAPSFTISIPTLQAIGNMFSTTNSHRQSQLDNKLDKALATVAVDACSTDLQDMRNEIGLEWTLSMVEKLNVLRGALAPSSLDEQLVRDGSQWSSLAVYSLVFVRDKSAAISPSRLLLNSHTLRDVTASNITDEFSSGTEVKVSPQLRFTHGKPVSFKPLLRALMSKPSALPKPSKRTLVLSGMRVTCSLPLLSLSSPKMLLQYKLADKHVRTSPQCERDEQSGGGFNFSEKLELSFRSDYAASLTLEICLVVQGVLLEEKIAWTQIEFLPFAEPLYLNQCISFSNWSQSFRVKQALERCSQNPSCKLPQLILSIELLTPITS